MTSRLLEVLFSNAIEATVAALALALVLRFWSPPAPLRHALWLLVIAKLLMPPLALHPYSLSGACARAAALLGAHGEVFGRGETAARPAEPDHRNPEPPPLRREPTPETRPEPAAPIPAGALAAPERRRPSAEPRCSAAPLSSAVRPRPHRRELTTCPEASLPEAVILEATGSRAPPPRREQPADRSLLLLPLLGALWAAGAAVAALRQGLAAAALHRKLRKGDLAPAAAGACAEISGRLGLRRAPEVRVIDGRFSPMVWALGRPLIVLPTELTSTGGAPPAAVLRSVLAHELAHVKRRDHWASWLELAAGVLYWWLPTLWWARRAARRAADQAADAWAVWVLGSRRTYAASLLEIVERLSSPAPRVHTLGAALGERENLERRLTMIVRDPLVHRLSWPALLGAFALGLVILPAAPRSLTGQAEPEEVAVEPPATEARAAPTSPRAQPPAPVQPPQSPPAPAAPPAAVPLAPPHPVAQVAAEPVPVPQPARPARAGRAARPMRLPAAARATAAAPAAEPQAAPAPAPGPRAASPAPADVEARLRLLEEKMDLVLDELRELRAQADAKPKKTTAKPAPRTATEDDLFRLHEQALKGGEEALKAAEDALKSGELSLEDGKKTLLMKRLHSDFIDKARAHAEEATRKSLKFLHDAQSDKEPELELKKELHDDHDDADVEFKLATRNARAIDKLKIEFDKRRRELEDEFHKSMEKLVREQDEAIQKLLKSGEKPPIGQ